MKTKTVLALAALMAAPLASADHHGDQKPATPAEEKAGDAKKADTTVVIESNDQMKYDKNEFKVKSGETVALTLKNVGKLPKVAMGHNLVILQTAVPVPAFAMSCMQAKENDYIPTTEEGKAQMIAHTKLLGPGEEDTITFTAPAVGTYNYVCTFPGHFGVMKGVMVVE